MQLLAATTSEIAVEAVQAARNPVNRDAVCPGRGQMLEAVKSELAGAGRGWIGCEGSRDTGGDPRGGQGDLARKVRRHVR